MNDAEVLEQLSATDVYAPGTEMPVAAWTRDAARSEIEWRIGMQTQKRAPEQVQRSPRWNGWLAAAAAAFVVVIAAGAVIWLVGSSASPDVVDTPATTVPTAPTTTQPPVTTTAALSPAADLTGSYVGELGVRQEELWSKEKLDAGDRPVSIVAWLELDESGDGYQGALRMSQVDFRLATDGSGGLVGNPAEGVLPPDTDVDWGRFPVVDVAAAGDEVTVSWDPSIGAAWDFTTRCSFEEVTLTFTIEENGDLLADAAGSFTRTGSTCRNPDTPVPFVLGELRRE